MTRSLRRAWIGAAALAVLAVSALLVAVPVFLGRALSPEAVARRASEVLGRDVRVGAVRMRFTPWLRVRVEGLTIAPDVAVDAVEIGVRARSLLRGRFEPDRIELAGAQLALRRGPAGRVSLASEAPTEGEGPSLPFLPAIELESAEIDLRDEAVADEPVHTRLRVESLRFEPPVLGSQAELRGTLGLGPTGGAGTLRLAGTLGPFDVADLGSSPLRLRVRGENVDPALLRPYLPASWQVRIAEGRLAGEVHVRRTSERALEADLALTLAPGRIALPEFELSGASRATCRLAWREGAFAIEDGLLAADEVAFRSQRGSRLRVAFDYRDGAFALASLELEALRGRAEIPALASLPDGFALELDGSGRIALRSRNATGGLLWGLAEAEARDVRLALQVPGRGPVRVRVEALALREVAEGERATLSLEAQLGETGAQGRLSLQAQTSPLPAAPRLEELAATIDARVEALDAELLTPFLPERWRARGSAARFDGRALLEGRPSELRGEVELELQSGHVALAELELGAPAFLRGVLATRDASLALPAGHLEADLVSFRDSRGRGLRTEFGFAEGALAIRSLRANRYEGALPGGDVLLSSLGLAVQLERADGIELAGETSEWPLRSLPWLRLPSGGTLREARASVVDPSDPGAPPLRIEVTQAEVRDFARGRVASLTLRAALGPPGMDQGSVELRGGLGPLGTEEPSLTLDVTSTALDPDFVLSRVPPGWQAGGSPGPVDARIAATGGGGQALRADVDVSMAGGVLRVRDVALGAPLSWRGRIQRGPGGVAVQEAHLEAAELAFRDFHAQDLRAEHAFQRATLSVTDLTARAYGGQWRQKGVVTFQDPPAFDVELSVTDADLGSLLRVDAGDPPGRLSGGGKFRGHWTGGERWLDPIAGTGRLTVEGGSIPGQKLARAVWESLVGVLRVPGLGAPGPEDRPVTPRTPLERADLPFLVEGGRVRTEGFDLVTPDYRLVCRGKMSSDWDVRLRGQISFTGQGVHNLLKFGRVPEPLRKGLRLPALPLEIRGPVANPTFRADASRVPLATIQGLLALPGRAKDVVRGTAGVARELTAPLIPSRRPSAQAEEPTPAPPGSEVETPAESEPEATAEPTTDATAETEGTEREALSEREPDAPAEGEVEEAPTRTEVEEPPAATETPAQAHGRIGAAESLDEGRERAGSLGGAAAPSLR